MRFATRHRLVLLCTTIGLLTLSTGLAVAASKPLGFTARYGFQAKVSVANAGTMAGSFPIDGEFHITLEQYKDGTPKEISFGLDRLASEAMGGQPLPQGKGIVGKSFSLLFDRSGQLTDFKPAIPGLDAKKLLNAKTGLEIRYHGSKTQSLAEQMRAIPAGTEITVNFSSPRVGSGEPPERDKVAVVVRFLGVSQDGANADLEFDTEFDSVGNPGVAKGPSDQPGKVTANAKIRGKASFELTRGLLSFLGVEGFASYAAEGEAPNDVGVNLTITLIEVKDLKR